MSVLQDSDLGLDQRSISDQTEQKQIKEGQDFAQRLLKSQAPDQDIESTPDSDSATLLLQEYDPVHAFFIMPLCSKIWKTGFDLPKT